MASKVEETRRIQELRLLLTKANEAYYQQAQPTLADTEFDSLMKELAQLEAKHPGLADASSPTRVVGGGTIEGFETVQHSHPMLSIDNSYSVEDVRAWYGRVVKGLDGAEPILACDPSDQSSFV